MDFEKHGGWVIGLVLAALGVYATFRKNKTDDFSRQIASLFDANTKLSEMVKSLSAMVDDRRKAHDREMEAERESRREEMERERDDRRKEVSELREQHVKDIGDVKKAQEACEADKLVAINLSSRQDAEIRSLTAQVKSFTERLAAAGIDRRAAGGP